MLRPVQRKSVIKTHKCVPAVKCLFPAGKSSSAIGEQCFFVHESGEQVFQLMLRIRPDENNLRFPEVLRARNIAGRHFLVEIGI